ncbi:GTP:AMP phosphotransferase AK3, mitochondrial-like [Petromyzon marinus]|uniref:GTP:AMP phosphotransferase AK3, mitochondrial n=1 Tax=Petromyzon marinus TaxID=7757 RepID=A0AAJ7TZ10_PETMA|nr:GTP:AMP phosphotransferase AK3, mitochondrial-like [Petromyzon marinus]
MAARVPVSRLALLGAPGSGKGTMAHKIRLHFGITSVASGELLRDHIYRRTEIGHRARSYIVAGRLVPDDFITHLVMRELQQRGDDGWVLDGFPRTLPQAHALECERVRLDAVLCLDVPADTIRQRLSSRWIHARSGRVYNTHFNPPRNAGRDDVTGEPLVQRLDDRPDAVVARLREYRERTQPLVTHFASRGLLHTFAGTETNKVWPEIHAFISSHVRSLG